MHSIYTSFNQDPTTEVAFHSDAAQKHILKELQTYQPHPLSTARLVGIQTYPEIPKVHELLCALERDDKVQFLNKTEGHSQDISQLLWRIKTKT